MSPAERLLAHLSDLGPGGKVSGGSASTPESAFLNSILLFRDALTAKVQMEAMLAVSKYVRQVLEDIGRTP
jgi:hypothetical protein